MTTEPRFEPKAHMMQLKGKEYLPVAWRLVWFREEHPDWYINTTLVEHDAEAGRAVVRAAVGQPGSDIVLATGHKAETRKDFSDYLEKAETGAIGRALATLGYGTQFAPELDESERIVDSPQPAQQHPVPTREREVSDNPNIVRSSDDQAWTSWCKVLAKAQDLGVQVQPLRLPQARSELESKAREVVGRIRARERELA